MHGIGLWDGVRAGNAGFELLIEDGYQAQAVSELPSKAEELNRGL